MLLFKTSAVLATWLVASVTAYAQASPGTPAKPARADQPPPAYRSSFEGYKRYGDEPIVPWREANDAVGRIGGWQAYAREAQGAPAAPGSAGKPASAPSAPAGGGPAGHGEHK